MLFIVLKEASHRQKFDGAILFPSLDINTFAHFPKKRCLFRSIEVYRGPRSVYERGPYLSPMKRPQARSD